MGSRRSRPYGAGPLRRVGTALVLGLVGLGPSGCLHFTTVSVPQKTSLERQLMGDLQPLSKREELAASVRAQGSVGAGSVDDLRARAIAARRRQLFNRDDIDQLEKEGCLGESAAAHVVLRPCHAGSAAVSLAQRLLPQENTDRAAIIDWAVATDPVLTPTDRPKVVALYAGLLQERAGSGVWVQTPAGQWIQK